MKQLPFPDYPHSERYSNFDRDFIDLLLKLGVPETLGAAAFALLVYVVRTEDARRYGDAPSFWIGSMADRCGLHRNNFKKYLQRCVSAGWLHWEKTSDRKIGIAWVTVPMRFESELKSSRSYGADRELVQRIVAQTSAEHVAQPIARSVAPTVAPSTLSTNPFSSSSDEWVMVENELSNSGINCIDQVLIDCRKHGLTPSDVLALVAWWREHREGFASPEGVLFCSLSKARLHLETGKLRTDLGSYFPKVSADFLQRAQSRRRAEHDAEAARKRDLEAKAVAASADTMRQLELDFGDQLDSLPMDEVLKLCRDDFTREMVRRNGRQAPSVRVTLLKALASQAS
ncbi:hypothetical protein [Schlesneria paludicola]|uniref:hypothetical protein n=1 Tax=Schlesneria paludicola TaxID=360056 RepID=UPI00029B425C|nr:hypothetical protein [Schlesneria paludicola]